MGDPVASESDFEAKLAGFVREYIRPSTGGIPSNQAERWVCTGLEWLLGGLLEGREGWTGWVDGIDPATDSVSGCIEVISAVELRVRGRALWGESSREGFWIEPFFGMVRISGTRDEILNYELKFGDAARGLGRHPYGKHVRRVDWFFPAEWLYSFTKGAVDATQLDFT